MVARTSGTGKRLTVRDDRMTYSWFAVLLILLLAVVIFDVRYRIIPNAASLAIATAFLLYAILELDVDQALWSILAALLVLSASAAVFFCGLIGGGDVKLLAACTLWTGWNASLEFLELTSILGGVLALAVVAFASLRRMLGPSVGRPAPEPSVPYGVAIAMSALWVIVTINPGVA